MSQIKTMVTWAYLKGYRVVEGHVVGPKGKSRKTRVYCRGKGQGYYVERFSVRGPGGQTIPIPVHQLAAFQKFGADALRTGVQVRHKNGDSLDNRDCNILVGSATDNALDQPQLTRQEHAAKGRQVYSSEFIRQLRSDYASGLGYKKLRKKYGVSLSMLSYYLSKKAQRTSFTFPK